MTILLVLFILFGVSTIALIIGRWWIVKMAEADGIAIAKQLERIIPQDEGRAILINARADGLSDDEVLEQLFAAANRHRKIARARARRST